MLKRKTEVERRPRTVLITGASRGIGEAAARYFHNAGWCVAATMRAPGESQLAPSNRLNLYEMDVTSATSIESAIRAAITDHGRIDVVVNNAGLCLLGAHEELTEADDRAIISTNILGTMQVTRALLPHFRATGGGRIVNVSSMCGSITLPLYSAYCASKWGIEGFSEALSFELRSQGIKVKLVQPGVHRTGSFAGQLSHRANRTPHPSYATFTNQVLPRLAAFEQTAPPPDAVAQAIYKAATERWPRLRYPVHSRAILTVRRLIPSALFIRAVRRALAAW